MTEERAVLAGGCSWGIQDLIRRYDAKVCGRFGSNHAGERDNAARMADEMVKKSARPWEYWLGITGST